ncbi:MAG TPA: paraquat-inducible protein A [Bryobacteraceae bacterium]|nr:paraquat-inducible protein A [Bryobacteraceae bacterium]
MIGIRLAAGVLLLPAAIMFTWLTIDGLSARRRLRTELAEISHVRYGLLNADRWMEKIMPILEANIDRLDLTAGSRASLRPTVVKALYRLLDDVKEKMSAKNSQSTGAGGFLGQGNALMVNLIVGALRPHVPEYADVVLAELGKPESQEAFKRYLKSVLVEGAKNTFGNVDLRWYSSILKQHGCADASGCQQELGNRIREADAKLEYCWLAVLLASAVAFVLLLTERPVLRRSSTVVLLLFCVVLLVGGVLTPMIEVEAKISRLGMTFLGEPIAFGDQVIYFQSKTVLEVFHTLVTQGRPDMWIVGVLVLMFSVVFPILKIFAASFCLYNPSLLRENQVARFLVLESSKWSMADVMALAIFMAFVAFNGLIANTMSGLKGTGAELAIPTDSSKLLPGYYLFIGFCLASLFLSKRLERGIRTSQGTEPD